MAKKMYTSPVFLTGLIDDGDHTEPYTNSQEIYTPDTPSTTYPDFMGLSMDQIANVMSLSSEDAWAMAGDDGVISLEEYLAVFPATSDPD